MIHASVIKVSVITPSVRKEGLIIVNESLKKQSFKEFEWLVCSPEDYGFGKWIKDPGKNTGDFYSLNKAYNLMIKQTLGELVISYQDGIKSFPDTLERFWEHYKMKPTAIVGAVGDQYATLDPPVKIWSDPRRTTKYGTFYECLERDVEYTLCSIPRKALFEVGGFDEQYDNGAAVSEKELNARMYKAGYKFFLDQSIEYTAIKHPRLTSDWDKYYLIASDLYSKHLKEIEAGKRLKLDFLS